jgi:hypothetical protein
MEIYGQKVSRQSLGKTFDDIVKMASEVMAKGISLIPIAISKNWNAFVNPSYEFFAAVRCRFLTCGTVIQNNKFGQKIYTQ